MSGGGMMRRFGFGLLLLTTVLTHACASQTPAAVQPTVTAKGSAGGEDLPDLTIRQVTLKAGETLLVGEGMLYPALHRLESQKWIEAEWGLSENNRHAKFYKLTAAGRGQLKTGLSAWQQFVEAASRALHASGSPRTA